MNESKYKKGQSLRERKCHIVLMWGYHILKGK